MTRPDQSPVDAFLQKYADEIQPADRAKIRENAVKAISGEPINLQRCPECLRAELRRIIISESYISRVKGQKFTMKETMPSAGRAEPSKLNSSRWPK